SDEEFEKLSEEDFTSDTDIDDKEDEDEDLGDDADEEPGEEANEDEPTDTAVDVGSEQAEEEGKSNGDQPNEEDLSASLQLYEETYKQLFENPIKASGREFQLKDSAQALNLIEMGVDYNKKMQHMRPHMQTLKTLEKEGLLDDTEQLNLLLEAKQGNPEAIKRLLSQAKIDLVDIADDEEGKEQYTPQNHIVSQAEIDIENALSSISESPAYQETIDTMSKSFDVKSKKIMSENPDYITALNSDIESGIYPKVMDMVQYQRDTRQIPDGMSDIEAYIGTVRQMAANEQQAAQPAPVQPSPEPAATRNPSNRRRKLGMSGSKSTPKKGAKREYDPVEVMSMSDDDFEKKFGAEL
ncbi:hypothetical protein J7J63_06155, partial [Candidatus Bipolaricaulota bacterium]|nr:hypothetical protein [Candidatus Bipolaricaulota bacterium]